MNCHHKLVSLVAFIIGSASTSLIEISLLKFWILSLIPNLCFFCVPQGTVLGPLLFTIYITAPSSVITKLKNIKHYLYADDTQIHVAITPENANSAITELQECLRSVQDWMAASKLNSILI